ncbi:MAG TPA: formyltetrahydrofolate deformylase [bacterium]|nr:formyltetrahydrofolate deformylase [bacterium]
MQQSETNSAVLLIHCPDKRGIVASVTAFVYEHHGNILYLDQHVDAEKHIFFMRIEWDRDGFTLTGDQIAEEFHQSVGSKFGMRWQLYFSYQTPRMAIFVSRRSHCLYDILARYEIGEWPVQIPVIISNHQDLRPVADRFGIDYHHVPITRDNKSRQERKQLNLLKEYEIDVIVLARYMQILTKQFVDYYPEKIINIHHSFLPAFPGARPYHSAYERGVKVIGATSHYVIPDLDAGPIIEQDVVHVSHTHTVGDLVRMGRDLEKVVLARAIRYHLQRKILVYDNRTVIFS